MARAALVLLVSYLLILGISPPALAKTASKHSAKHAEKHAPKSSGAKHASHRRVHVKVAARRHSSRHAALPRLVAAPAVPVVPPVRTAGDMAGLNLRRPAEIPVAMRALLHTVLVETNEGGTSC